MGFFFFLELCGRVHAEHRKWRRKQKAVGVDQFQTCRSSMTAIDGVAVKHKGNEVAIPFVLFFFLLHKFRYV